MKNQSQCQYQATNYTHNINNSVSVIMSLKPQHTEDSPKVIRRKILLCAHRQQYQVTSGSLLELCMFASIIITHLP